MHGAGSDLNAIFILHFLLVGSSNDWYGPTKVKYFYDRSFKCLKDEHFPTWDEKAAENLIVRLSGHPPANVAQINCERTGVMMHPSELPERTVWKDHKEMAAFRHPYIEHPSTLEALMAARSSETSAIICRDVDDVLLDTCRTPKALLEAGLMMSSVGFRTGLRRLRYDPRMARRKLDELLLGSLPPPVKESS